LQRHGAAIVCNAATGCGVAAVCGAATGYNIAALRQVAAIQLFAALRQLATLRRCGSLQCYVNLQCSDAMQLARQRHCNVGTTAARNATLQRYVMYATVRAATTGGAWLLCSDGSCCHHLNFFFNLNFLAAAGVRKKEKGKGSFETCSRISTQHECNTQAPSCSNSSSNLHSLLALLPAATTPH